MGSSIKHALSNKINMLMGYNQVSSAILGCGIDK